MSWRRQAILIGWIVGHLSAMAVATVCYPPINRCLDRVIPFEYGLWNGSDVVGLTMGAQSLLILPGLLSYIAQRNYFYWGLLPPALFCFWTGLEVRMEHGRLDREDIGIALEIMITSAAMSAGPVSLLRYLHHLRHLRSPTAR